MRAWQVTHYGEPEEMVFADIPVPEPGPGQVLIRNRACGLNFFNILQIQGKYQSRPDFPFSVGAEVGGTVEAVGEGVTNISLGDRVIGLPMNGGFAEYTVVDTLRTFPIPEGMSFETAAAFPLVYQTSWYALDHRTEVREGEWLLVHAGASGVGVAAIEIGKAKGARVIATAGSDEKLLFCAEHGAEQVINYRDDSWVDRVKEITGGRGADIIYDPVGGDVFDLSSKCIAPDGRLLVVGFAAGRIPSIAANRLLLKNMAAVGVFWGRHAEEHPEYPAQAQAALTKLYLEGKLDPPVDQTFPLEEAPAALAALAQRRIRGKAVLAI